MTQPNALPWYYTPLQAPCEAAKQESLETSEVLHGRLLGGLNILLDHLRHLKEASLAARLSHRCQPGRGEAAKKDRRPRRMMRLGSTGS